MGLTRKYLKGMNLTDEQVDSIIEAHLDSVNALKAEAEKFKGDSEKLAEVQKELDTLKAKGDDGYKEKFEKAQKELDDFKADVTAKETKAKTEKAVREYYESKNIKGKSLDIAMRGSAGEIASAKLDANGKLTDTKALDDLVSGMFSGLVSQTETTGARTETPPANVGNKSQKTKEEIINIKDAGERMQAIAENPQLFGIAESKD